LWGAPNEDFIAMSDFNRGVWGQSAPAKADMSVDAGLRSFMLGVYNKLALGLIVSAALAFITSAYAPARDLFYVVDSFGRLTGFTVLGMVLRFAPLAIILFGMFAMRNATPRSSGILYWAIVGTIGASLGVWAFIYSLDSIATTFLITATAFGGLSLVGYATKRDLTAMGSFLIMGVWGLLVASLVNMFLHLPGISLIISIVGVLLFSGLIAYDTQRLKMTYYQLGGDKTSMAVATNYGALSLYLDFINLFQFLMAIFGGRR
jgi:FtsH-binding integral membrane protein